MNTVATTRILPDTTTSVDVGDEVEAIQLPSLDERVRGLLEKEKPITVWKAAAKLGVGYINQVSAVLDGLTTEGSLATFKVGFNKYYALPKVALTSKEPTLITIISDSLEGLFLGCRYEVMAKLEAMNKCSQIK